MLDAFIIEEIRRRERDAEEQRERQRIRPELPQVPPDGGRRAPSRNNDDENSGDRGVVIIDYTIEGYSF